MKLNPLSTLREALLDSVGRQKIEKKLAVDAHYAQQRVNERKNQRTTARKTQRKIVERSQRANRSR